MMSLAALCRSLGMENTYLALTCCAALQSASHSESIAASSAPLQDAAAPSSLAGTDPLCLLPLVSAHFNGQGVQQRFPLLAAAAECMSAGTPTQRSVAGGGCGGTVSAMLASLGPSSRLVGLRLLSECYRRPSPAPPRALDREGTATTAGVLSLHALDFIFDTCGDASQRRGLGLLCECFPSAGRAPQQQQQQQQDDDARGRDVALLPTALDVILATPAAQRSSHRGLTLLRDCYQSSPPKSGTEDDKTANAGGPLSEDDGALNVMASGNQLIGLSLLVVCCTEAVQQHRAAAAATTKASDKDRQAAESRLPALHEPYGALRLLAICNPKATPHIGFVTSWLAKNAHAHNGQDTEGRVAEAPLSRASSWDGPAGNSSVLTVYLSCFDAVREDPTALQAVHSCLDMSALATILSLADKTQHQGGNTLAGLQTLAVALQRRDTDEAIDVQRKEATEAQPAPETPPPAAPAFDWAPVFDALQQDEVQERRGLMEQSDRVLALYTACVRSAVGVMRDELGNRQSLDDLYLSRRLALISAQLKAVDSDEIAARQKLALEASDAWYAVSQQARLSVAIAKLFELERRQRAKLVGEERTATRPLVLAQALVVQRSIMSEEASVRFIDIDCAARRSSLECDQAAVRRALSLAERNQRFHAIHRAQTRLDKELHAAVAQVEREALMWWARLRMERDEVHARDTIRELCIDVKARMAIKAVQLFGQQLLLQHAQTLYMAVLPALELLWRSQIEKIWERTTLQRLEAGLPQMLRGPFVATALSTSSTTALAHHHGDGASGRGAAVMIVDNNGSSRKPRVIRNAVMMSRRERETLIASMSTQCRSKPSRPTAVAVGGASSNAMRIDLTPAPRRNVSVSSTLPPIRSTPTPYSTEASSAFPEYTKPLKPLSRTAVTPVTDFDLLSPSEVASMFRIHKANPPPPLLPSLLSKGSSSPHRRSSPLRLPALRGEPRRR